MKRELANTTSHVAAAWRALRVCIDTVRGVHHSGWWKGTRSWNTVARTPPRWAGYIRSLKTNASSAPTTRSTRRPAEPAPGGPERVRGGEPDQLFGDRDARRSRPGSRRALAGSSARRRRARAGRRPPRPSRRASRGCSSRSRCAGARAGRRRPRSSPARLPEERIEVEARAPGRRSSPGRPRTGSLWESRCSRRCTSRRRRDPDRQRDPLPGRRHAGDRVDPATVARFDARRS